MKFRSGPFAVFLEVNVLDPLAQDVDPVFGI